MFKTGRLLVASVAAIATAGLALMPTANAQAQDEPASPGRHSVEVERHIGPAGVYDSWTITHVHGDNAIGSATFDAYGEKLRSCDQEKDGDTVRAGLELDRGSGSGWAVDPNGYGNPCGYNNLSTDENEAATLYVCVDDHGCWSTRVHT